MIVLERMQRRKKIVLHQKRCLLFPLAERNPVDIIGAELCV